MVHFGALHGEALKQRSSQIYSQINGETDAVCLTIDVYEFNWLMIKGTVKFFSPAKGFGFIAPDDGGKDIYIHAAVLKGAGVDGLKPGQKVLFKAESKTKGLEATGLELVEAAVQPKETTKQVRVYCDPLNPDLPDILSALNAARHGLQIVDYTAAALTHDQMKRLSAQLRAEGQSLVHRYAPLYFELQLDDRFIGEAEYWTAIAEHPSLIVGPIVAIGDRARVCKSVTEASVFLGLERPGPAAAKEQGIPPGMAAILKGMPPPVKKALNNANGHSSAAAHDHRDGAVAHLNEREAPKPEASVKRKTGAKAAASRPKQLKIKAAKRKVTASPKSKRVAVNSKSNRARKK